LDFKNRISHLPADTTSGFAAMLVALPSSIAYGILIFSALGASFTGQAALAGILGTICLSMVAGLFGGTNKLVTAPAAPAATILAVFVTDQIASGSPPEQVHLMVCLVGGIAGIFQFIFGNIGGGKLIKYVPYPVIAGYLSAVGILLIKGQLNRLLGVPKSVEFLPMISQISQWNPINVAVGGVTLIAMFITSKTARKIPPAIISLTLGVGTFFLIGSMMEPSLLNLEGNKYVVGNIIPKEGGVWKAVTMHWDDLTHIPYSKIPSILIPALSLAFLLSIDTLKTSLVLDAMTQTRHDSNKELIGQGLANLFSSIFGGVPGAGTMGPTLVNVSSGAKTPSSSVLVGVFSLIVLVLFANYLAWIPVPAQAAILIFVGIRMVDFKSVQLIRFRATQFDFFVILAVVMTAIFTSLLMAGGVGIFLAIFLFLREQTRFSVVRRKYLGNQKFSKKRRVPSEAEVLSSHGGKSLVLELQGQLFFGTTDQLFTIVESYLKTCDYFTFDMRRIQSIDYTAVNMLKQIAQRIKSKNQKLIMSSVPMSLPSGQDLKAYLHNLGLSEEKSGIIFFNNIDEALEWVENDILAKYIQVHKDPKAALELNEFEFFKTFSPNVINELKVIAIESDFGIDENVFHKGDSDDRIYFIRKGIIKIQLPLPGNMTLVLATVGKGDFFGDMAFLDKETRSADAIADSEEVQLYCFSRTQFDEIAKNHPEIAGVFFEKLAHTISLRMRQSLIELSAVQE
jgi:SulP family sulfate permease